MSQSDSSVPYVMTVRDLKQITIGDVIQHNAPITLVPYDPGWPRQFDSLATSIRAALGDRVLLIEHAGSTSVPGLSAKPKIDIVLAVADSADEPAYVPDLNAAGFTIRIREPDWYEHRLFIRGDIETNVHTFSLGSPEIDKMLLFRDWLRTHDDDRDLYQRTKLDLAAQTWAFVQNYADAKSTVVEEIVARARSARAAGTWRGSVRA